MPAHLHGKLDAIFPEPPYGGKYGAARERKTRCVCSFPERWLARQGTKKVINILTGYGVARASAKEGSLLAAAYLVEVFVQGISGFLRNEDFGCPDLALPLYVLKMLALVLGSVDCHQLGNAKTRV